MHSRQKWALAVPGSILTPFCLLFGCLGQPKRRFQEGVKKNVDFWDHIFPTLTDFRHSGGAQTSCTIGPFPLHFRSWGLIFVLGCHFWSCWTICVFLDSFFYECSWFLHSVFCERGCIFWGDMLPWIFKVLPETAKILINFFTYQRQEFSGVRRFSRQRSQ